MMTPKSLRCAASIGILAAVVGLVTFPVPAATDFPAKPVTYPIPFDPGGQSDREARPQQPDLEKILGQHVPIDYKLGGGRALGRCELVKSGPDGYTIAAFNIPHIILQPLQQEVGYKTEQIVPVALFQRTLLALAALNTIPFKTPQEFVDYAKNNPGDLTVGSSGTFSGPHIAALRFQNLTGTTVTYVPFTGAAPQTMAFLGGHVPAAFSNSDDLVRYKDKVRVLAFASEQRFPDFPDTPTLRERRIHMVEAIDPGVAVPPGPPDAVI